MEIRDHVVWITGASSGIGAALAKECAREGGKLLLSARREDRLKEVAEECRTAGAPVVEVLPLDLEDVAALPAMAEEAERRMGPVDILVNNGGMGQRALGYEAEPAVVQKIMDINFFGHVALTRAIVPKMIERKAGQIVVTSSVCGKFSVPGRSMYCASKHALQGYYNSLRAEVHKHGLRVTLFCPGWIQSEISLHAVHADGSTHAKMDQGQRHGMPADVCARKMVAAIRRNKREVYIGGWLEWCGLACERFFPNLFAWGIRRFPVN